MVSCLANPQCGQVSTDSRTTVFMVQLLLHSGWKTCVRRRHGQRLRLGLVGVIGDSRRLLGEIDLDNINARHFLQRLLHHNRASSAAHVLHIQRDSFRGRGQGSQWNGNEGDNQQFAYGSFLSVKQWSKPRYGQQAE